MERLRAKQMAETATVKDVLEMLENAKKSTGIAWNSPSATNVNITNGKAMEIFTGYVLRNPEDIDEMAMINMIQCFGDYFPIKMEDVVELEDWEIGLDFGEWMQRNWDKND